MSKLLRAGKVRVVVLLMLFSVFGAGNVVAQSEILRDGQSGVTVSASRFSAQWSNNPDHISSFAVTGTINDMVDLSFSYTRPRNHYYRPIRTLAMAVHFNSRASESRAKFAAIVEVNVGSVTAGANFLGLEMYQNTRVTKNLSLIPIVKGGLVTVSRTRSFTGTNPESEIAGSVALGISFALAKDVKLTVSPFYSFASTSFDVIGASVSMTIHNLGKRRSNANWDELSYAQ